MEKFVTLDSPAIPLVRVNIDTDQLIPARFLQKPRKSGLANYLLHDQRFAEDGAPADFVMNDSRLQGAHILVAGRNFGCGSSREAAVYAMWDYGLRAVIAASFGDIFFNNCLKNGLLPVTLPADRVEAITAQLVAKPGAHMRVDLNNQIVTAPRGQQVGFNIDPFTRNCLLQGLDELDYTRSLALSVAEFEAKLAVLRPWL